MWWSRNYYCRVLSRLVSIFWERVSRYLAPTEEGLDFRINQPNQNTVLISIWLQRRKDCTTSFDNQTGHVIFLHFLSTQKEPDYLIDQPIQNTELVSIWPQRKKDWTTSFNNPVGHSMFIHLFSTEKDGTYLINQSNRTLIIDGIFAFFIPRHNFTFGIFIFWTCHLLRGNTTIYGGRAMQQVKRKLTFSSKSKNS